MNGLNHSGSTWKDRARAEWPHIKQDACIGGCIGATSVVVSLVAMGIFAFLLNLKLTWDTAARFTQVVTMAIVPFGMCAAVHLGMKNRKTL